jgi:hypothetical protein
MCLGADRSEQHCGDAGQLDLQATGSLDAHGIKADRASVTERGRKHVEMGYVAQYEAAVGQTIR